MKDDPSRPVTIAQIAEVIGRSKNTVSLALRDSTRVSEQVRLAVREAADRLGYVPVHAAVQLTTKKSGLVGLYTRSLQDAVRTTLVDSLIARVHEAGFRPILGLGDGFSARWQESPWMNTFRSMRVQALMVLIDRIGSLPPWFGDIPAIFAGCHPPRVREREGLDSVALDRREAAILGAEHLLEQGCKSLVVVAPKGHEFGRATLALARRRGIGCRSVPIGDLRPDTAARIADGLQDEEEQPDGILISDAGFATAFLRRFRGRKRKHGRKTRVVAYDYFPWADDLSVPLTTIEQPVEELARRAMEMVRRRLENPSAPSSHVVLRHRLVVRRSSSAGVG